MPRFSRVQYWLMIFCLAGNVLAEDSPGPRSFTIATYNIYYGNRNLPELVSTIRGAGADFLALQETNPGAEKYLRQRLGKEYPHMAFRDGTRGSDGFGFLSRRPLRALKFLEALPGCRGTWLVEVSLGGTNLQIVSVHLATPKSLNAKTLPAMLQLFEQAETLHAREIRRIADEVSNTMPVIVLGDFNSFSFSAAPGFLREQGFVDSFAAVNDKPDQHGTWSAGNSGLQFRIDFIFHSPRLKTLSSRILKSDASDHRLVVSELAVPIATGANQ